MRRPGVNPATPGLADVYSPEKAHRKSTKSDKETFLKIKVYNVFNVRGDTKTNRKAIILV